MGVGVDLEVAAKVELAVAEGTITGVVGVIVGVRVTSCVIGAAGDADGGVTTVISWGVEVALLRRAGKNCFH